MTFEPRRIGKGSPQRVQIPPPPPSLSPSLLPRVLSWVLSEMTGSFGAKSHDRGVHMVMKRGRESSEGPFWPRVASQSCRLFRILKGRDRVLRVHVTVTFRFARHRFPLLQVSYRSAYEEVPVDSTFDIIFMDDCLVVVTYVLSLRCCLLRLLSEHKRGGAGASPHLGCSKHKHGEWEHWEL